MANMHATFHVRLVRWTLLIMAAMKSIVAAAGLISLASAVPHAQVPYRRQTATSYGTPSVTVKNGTLSGVHKSNYGQDYFLGIPFAQPPVEQLRFRNPQSINTTYDGVYEATEYAPECYGYGVSSVSWLIRHFIIG